jgi:hypothetical protein
MKKAILSSSFIFILISSISGQGIFDASIHQAIPFGNVDSPPNESPQQVIDQDPETKFLDFMITDGIGFEVDLLGQSFIATSMEIVTANDAPERDPTNYQIWGSNDGVTFDSITSGPVPCVDDRFLARTIAFENTVSHSYYRLEFTGICSPSAINQIADVQLYTAIGSVPEFTCPSDVTLDNNEGLCSAAFDYDVSVEDAEDGSLTPSFESGYASGEFFPVGSTTVIWSAIDSDGNKASCTFNVTVEDLETPTCPEDIIVNIPEGATSAVVEFDLSNTDNCTVIDTIENFIPLVTLEGESYYISNAFFFPQDAFFEAVINGGWLGTVKTEAYNTSINKALKRFVGNFEVLNGLNDINQEGVFTWQNEDPSTYTNWQDEEPNNANDNEDYVIMKPNGEWNDVSGSDNQFPYLFQKTYTPTQTGGLASGESYPLGTTTNTFELIDIYGNVSTCSFDVIVQTSTATNEIDLQQKFTISPNPTNGLLFLDNQSNQKIIEVKLYNTIGKEVKKIKLEKSADNQFLDLSNLANGSYYLHIESSLGIIVKKVIKI